MARSNWVVEISDTHGGFEDCQYGPYSQRRAEEICEAFNRRRELSSFVATAYPLPRCTIPELLAEFPVD